MTILRNAAQLTLVCVLSTVGLIVLADDDQPHSNTVAAQFLKKVDSFQRKVVFFQKDVDLPCLRLPERDEPVKFSILDLKTGSETTLPIKGRAGAWHTSSELFYIEEEDRGKGVRETSLCKFRVGDKKGTRLFSVSCQRAEDPIVTIHHQPPVLSWDRKWLAWRLPVESPESGTILIDLEKQEYRVLDGEWAGVQLFK